MAGAMSLMMGGVMGHVIQIAPPQTAFRLHAPRAALQLDDAAPWTTLATRDLEQLAEVRRVLEMADVPVADVGTVDGGVNKAMPLRRFIDPEDPRRAVTAVVKEVGHGSAQEVFAAKVARAMHVDYLLPAVARRAGGVAAIEFRPGVALTDARLATGGGVEHALRQASAAAHPALSSAEVRRHARVNRQLVQAFDVVIQNADRHGQNGLHDAATGAFTLIDHGQIGNRWLKTYRGGAGMRNDARGEFHVLLPEARALLDHVDRPAIERAFEQAVRDQSTATVVGVGSGRMGAEYLDGVMGRLDTIQRTGRVDVH